MLLMYTYPLASHSMHFAASDVASACPLTHVACLSVSLRIWSLVVLLLQHLCMFHMRCTCVVTVATCHTGASAMRPK